MKAQMTIICNCSRVSTLTSPSTKRKILSISTCQQPLRTLNNPSPSSSYSTRTSQVLAPALPHASSYWKKLVRQLLRSLGPNFKRSRPSSKLQIFSHLKRISHQTLGLPEMRISSHLRWSKIAKRMFCATTVCLVTEHQQIAIKLMIMDQILII